jgi:hypothetical protein
MFSQLASPEVHLKVVGNKVYTSASSFIAAHIDRHCTMDHDHSCFSSMDHGHISLQTVIPDYRTAHSYFKGTMRQRTGLGLLLGVDYHPKSNELCPN